MKFEETKHPTNMKISHFCSVSYLSSGHYKNENFEKNKKTYKHEFFEYFKCRIRYLNSKKWHFDNFVGRASKEVG
jgi:hypothetical protein